MREVGATRQPWRSEKYQGGPSKSRIHAASLKYDVFFGGSFKRVVGKRGDGGMRLFFRDI